jgi:hypothetical protein
MDNLNTHAVSSLYKTFAPEIALNLSKRLEIHFTPKHGSWLNIAEIELSAMTRQSLGKRIATLGACRTSFLFKCPKKRTELKEKQKCEPICMKTALIDL